MLKVLLVEDEELIVQGLTLTTPWKDYGLEVVGIARDGIQGMQLIEELCPDIVITDVRMPRMDGLTMIERMREKVSCEYIILSGYDEFAYAKKALSLEVHGYLLKPVDDAELEETLKLTVRRIREKRQVYRELSERMAENGVLKPPKLKNIQDKYLDHAIQILRSCYKDNLTLKSVADELFISDSYLGKLFKGKTGYTFLEMLTFYRIREAVRLLKETDMKVYEISYAVGYSDPRYFSRVFQKVAGIKPMEVKNGHSLLPDNILNHI